jgi:hypothetical protein
MLAALSPGDFANVKQLTDTEWGLLQHCLDGKRLAGVPPQKKT